MTREEFLLKYPWIDPTVVSKTEKLKEGITKIDKHIAVRTGSAHKGLEYIKPIHSIHLEHVDGHDWEIFRADKESDKYYWGMYVEGIGAFNVMVPKEFTRELLPAERTAWSKMTPGMYGSHSLNLSYTFPSGVKETE